MVSMMDLWLPILLSAVAVFAASSVIHMAPLWHKNDYPAVPDQDAVMDALRPFAIAPGDYMLPRAAEMKDMQSPEFVEKMKRGPIMMLTVIPNGPVNMGRPLSLWFVYIVVISVLTAYLSSRALGFGAAPVKVVQVAATAAFMGYALGIWQMTIWYRRAGGQAVRETFDGVIYALITAGILAWMWPGA